MDNLGINFDYLLVQLLALAIILGWAFLNLISLRALRRIGMPGIAQALWFLIILAIPVLGAVAFLVVRPADRQ